MCIIIDANTIPAVFNKKSSNHNEFRPVLDWIDSSKGKLVYGGKTYTTQLRRMPNYFNIFQEYEKRGKTYVANRIDVDRKEEQINNYFQNSACDDAHIIALVIVTKCRLVCSKDADSHSFIRESSLYPRHVSRPLIYSNGNHRELLYRRNIARRCGPCSHT